MPGALRELRTRRRGEQRGGHRCVNCCGDAKQGGLLRTLILTPRPSLFVSSRVGGGGRACVDSSGGASGPGVPPPPTGGRSGGGSLASRDPQGQVWDGAPGGGIRGDLTAARPVVPAGQSYPREPRDQVRHGAAGGIRGFPRGGADGGTGGAGAPSRPTRPSAARSGRRAPWRPPSRRYHRDPRSQGPDGAPAGSSGRCRASRGAGGS
jgi:hypothetical protein